MYKLTGGCCHEHYCGECEYLRKSEKKLSFGKKHIDYECSAHPEGGRWWSMKYIACKKFKRRNRFGEGKNGQLYFIL